MEKKGKVWLGAGMALVVSAGYFSGPVRSETGLRVADDEVVIVETSEHPGPSAERIGRSDFYRLDMGRARQLAARRPSVRLHPVQEYEPTLSVNDPLEPQAYLDLLDAPSLWDETTGSPGVTVAVIDSGFALEHEDMTGRWFANTGEQGATGSEGPAPNCTSQSLPLDKSCNNLDDDANGFIDDWRGWDFAQDDNDPSAGTTDPSGDAVDHGTAVSGLVGATGNNALGAASLNWQASILPLQIFTDEGSATTVEVAEAIDYAIAMGADVINLSLGSTGSDSTIESLLAQAVAENIVSVAAAGNCGGIDYAAQGCSFQGQTLYPGTSDHAIAVAATDLSDERAGFSSWGSKVDLAAPGSGTMHSTLYDQSDPAGAYSASLFGTSFSTPITSGAAALVRDTWPGAEPADIRAVLVDSARRVSEMSGQTFTEEHGFGRLQPLKTVELAEKCETAGRAQDINCDGSVNLLDLSFLVGQWELANAGRSDINQSGLTNLLDLSALVGQWGT